jgi:DNA polymerase III subunit epsilon
VVDLELSGLDPGRDEIVSFAAVPVEDGRVLAGESVYSLVRPTRPVPAGSVLIHGIRTIDLAEAPVLSEALPGLLHALTGRVLVAHAAEVERSFLGPALRRAGTRLRGPVLDTEVLGRLLQTLLSGSAPPRLSLGELVSSLGLPSHRPHHAMGDALTTAQAFLAVASKLDGIERETVRSLARAPDRLRELRRFPRPVRPAQHPPAGPD